MASFKASFAAARKAGKKEFTWNGKRYNTKLKEDSAPKPKARPSNKPTTSGSTKSNPKSVAKPTQRSKSPRPKSRPTATKTSAGPIPRVQDKKPKGMFQHKRTKGRKR